MSIAEKLQTIAENEQRVYEAGRTKGIEEGKQAEYDQFWDAFQNYGNMRYLPHVFAGGGWNDHTFKPKYDIIAEGNANGIFRQTGVIDIRQRLLECGVTLDTSGATALQYAFAYGKITSLPKIDCSSLATLDSTFRDNARLVLLEELVVTAGLKYTNPFNNCTALTELRISGTIGQNGFNVSSCTKLTHDSLISIINALKSGVSGLTVTLGTTNLAKLTDAEKAIATQKGWTLL